MWIRTFVAACAGLVLSVPSATAHNDLSRTEAQAVGLWDIGFSPQLTAADCGRWRLDARGFCTANDVRDGVELGMKFQTSRALEITGVRVYRVDPGTVAGSLRDGDGTPLATGTFAETGTFGWQDLLFATPVTVRADRTYLATYYSPATRYAFQYTYYRDQLSRGPVTALRSVEVDPNGVFCYDVHTCDYPRRGYRDSNYWVTPLWESPPDALLPPPALPEPPSDRVSPSVHTAMPRAGERRVRLNTTIKIVFSEPVRSTLLTRATVRLLRKGHQKPVPVRLRYDVSRNRLTLTPRGGLLPRSTYRVVISAAVVDAAGNRLDQDPSRPGAQRATWAFRTRGGPGAG